MACSVRPLLFHKNLLMETHTGIEAHNWFGDIRFTPGAIVRPTSEEELIAIVKDTARYPSPIRAAGSRHSTTQCVVPDSGTVVDMKGMNRIVSIGADTVVAQAGALYIDVAKELEKHNLQFYVNIELGNLSMGAAACTHTKDASFHNEYGQVCSYAVGLRAVLPSGEVLVVTEEQPELLQAMRTSFGLLGVVFEVTFRVKPLRPMAFHHESFQIEDFGRQLPEIRNRAHSVMYFLFPFEDRLTVEFRNYLEGGAMESHTAWRIRNLAWKTVVPALGAGLRNYLPHTGARSLMHRGIGSVTRAVLKTVRSGGSYAADQMIRYPDVSGPSRYTFSIWAFPEEGFPGTMARYFAFCRDHYRKHGYRCDIPNVGYRINQDQSSLFSYTFNGTAMTLDPVSTAGPGWPEFLDAYNEFCSENGGSPLFNQTARLTTAQVEKAFGDRIETFRGFQRRYDPDHRFVNSYFAKLLGLNRGADPRTL